MIDEDVKIMSVADIVEDNGKTVRENNLDRSHNIPLGTLVEVKYSKWLGNGACIRSEARLFVVSHDRDCDETPLYRVAEKPLDTLKAMVRDDCDLFEGYGWYGRMDKQRFWNIVRALGIVIETGFGEESLTPIEVTDELKQGFDAITWDEPFEI